MLGKGKKSLFWACLLILALIFPLIPIVNTTPLYEDFTSYTEVEPDDRIQKTANHIDFYCRRDEDAYLYKDFGVGHFSDFEHLIDFRTTDMVTNFQMFGLWDLANEVDNQYGIGNANPHIFVRAYRTGGGIETIEMYEGYDNNWYGDVWSFFVNNVWYYLRIKKFGTALTCRIWTDATDRDNNDIEATSYKDQLTLTLHDDHSFRYIYACITWNDGQTYYCNGDIENLYLEEACTVTFYNNSGGILKVNGTTISNGTSKVYCLNDVIELGALPLNSSYIFKNFTWDPTDQYFTTYQEVDPNEHISKSANRVTFTELNRDEDAYVYRDYGVSYFTDFTHDFDFRITNESEEIGYGLQGQCAGWILTNDLDDLNALSFLNKTAILVFFDTMETQENNRVRLIELYNQIWYGDLGGWFYAMNTTYYVRVVKNGASLLAGFYSTSDLRNAGNGMNGDIENLSATLHQDHSFRYIGTSWSFDDNYEILWLSGYVENLDLHLPNYSKTNPHNLTIVSDLTVWCYFEPQSRFFPYFALGLLFALFIGLIFGLALFYDRKQ